MFCNRDNHHHHYDHDDHHDFVSLIICLCNVICDSLSHPSSNLCETIFCCDNDTERQRRSRNHRANQSSPLLSAQADELENLINVRSEGWDLDEDEGAQNNKVKKDRRNTNTSNGFKYSKKKPMNKSAVVEDDQRTLVNDNGDGNTNSMSSGNRGETWEPEMTQEELAREEAEQAERDRLEASRFSGMVSEEDDFGDYVQPDSRGDGSKGTTIKRSDQ